jgi:hypothetical protein
MPMEEEMVNEFIGYLNKYKILAPGNLFLCDPNDKGYQKNCSGRINKTLFYESIWESPFDKTGVVWIDAYEKLTARSDINLFLLTGYEGTGKTTLLNGLLYDVKKNNAKEKKGYNRINFDFNHDVDGLLLLRRTICREFGIGVSSFNATKKFFVLLLYGFGKTVDKIGHLPNNNDFWNEISVFFNALKEHLGDHYEEMGDKMRDILVNNKDIIKDINSNTNKDKMFQDLKDCFFAGEDYRNNIIPLMKSILYLQLSIAYYEAKNAEQPDNNFKDINLYWTFDNIEHFIIRDEKGYPVRDKEIVEIYNRIKSFAGYYMRYMGYMREFTYNGINQQLKIIFVVRNVTNNEIFAGSSAQQQTLPNFLISSLPKNQDDLLTAKNTIENRYRFFKRLNGDSGLKDQGKKTVENILEKVGIIIELMKDNEGPTSFGRFIEKMFNYDIRRIVKYLFKVVESDPVSNKYRKLLNLPEDSYLEPREIKRIQRRTALNLVFSKVLDHDNILSELELITDGEGRLGYSYARQILTYLYNMSVDGKTVTFSLFKKDLCGDTMKDHKYHFEHLCKVLYRMSCYNTFHIWTQLVEIETGKNITNEKELSAQIDDEYKNRETNESTLKITPAGGFFAFILCDFEYFAIRYMQSLSRNEAHESDSTALFLYNFNTEKRRITDTITKISEKALECIEKAIEFDKIQCGGDYSDEGLHRKENYYLWRNIPNKSRDSSTVTTVTHPQRILDNFITYLDCYRRFVILKNKDDVETCRSFSELIIEKIKVFIGKIKELTEEIENDRYYISGDHILAEKLAGVVEKFSYLYQEYSQGVDKIEKSLEKLRTTPSESGKILDEMGIIKIQREKKHE